jgi:hypothetical protein
MAAYSQFVGRTVTVEYRAGDVVLPASGTLVADSGRSIFLEQHVEQRGRTTYFRWEIPYGYIHRLDEALAAAVREKTEAQTAAPLQTRAAAAGATSANHTTTTTSGGLLMPLPTSEKTA